MMEFRIIRRTEQVIERFNINEFRQYNDLEDITIIIEFYKCIFLNINPDINLNVNIDYFPSNIIFKFSYCTFRGRVNMNNIVFKAPIYFNNSKFENSVDFHECIFKDIACFYGVTFNEAPNFSQAIFKENLNLVNTNLDFNYKRLEIKITKEHNIFTTNYPNIEKKLSNFANDFRDSFRNFKNALSKDSNNIDASNYHKCELYSKEIELENSYETLKDKIDLYTLKFYRILSDHHTDLLKVFNNLVILIALFFISTFGIIDSKNALSSYAYKSGENFSIFEYKIENKDKDFNTLVLKNKQTNLQNSLKDKIKNIVNFFRINNLFYFIVLLFTFMGFILVIYGIIILFDDFFITVFSYSIVLTIALFLWFINCITKFTYIFLCFIFICSYIYLIYNINIYNYDLNIFIMSVLNISFIITYALLINSNKIIKFFIILLSYIVLILIISSGNLIFLAPILGKLTTDFNPENELFISLSFTYTILMFLVLFSLQKTARRNSLVSA